jgi:integrase
VREHEKKALTTKAIAAIKPAAPGERDMIWDTLLPSFGIRVTDKGSAAFIVHRRIGKTGSLVRVPIGPPWRVPVPRANGFLPFDLSAAREEARGAIAAMHSGVDPRTKKKEAVEAAKRREESTLGAVAERYITEHVAKLKRPDEVAAGVRRAWEPIWSKPIAEVDEDDVSHIVREIAKDRQYAAYHAFAAGSGLFSWAIAQRRYGLKNSPFRSLKVKDLVGKRDPRQRILSDGELRALWRATSDEAGLGYPLAPFVRMLALTGQRLREVAEAAWAEFDLDNRLWTIPPERMKGDGAHEVPLSEAVVRLLKELPRGRGQFVFSTTDGARPISGFSKGKTRLDRALGDIGGWRFHDIRRTVRTGLGGLPVPTKVAELVIAHAQPGLHKVYDLHKYRDEKRRALDLWASKLLGLVEPNPPGNLVHLASARA